MTLSKKELGAIAKKYCFNTSEIEDAFLFVERVLEEEIKVTREKFPYATNTIMRLEGALCELYSLTSDFYAENFGE